MVLWLQKVHITKHNLKQYSRMYFVLDIFVYDIWLRVVWQIFCFNWCFWTFFIRRNEWNSRTNFFTANYGLYRKLRVIVHCKDRILGNVILKWTTVFTQIQKKKSLQTAVKTTLTWLTMNEIYPKCSHLGFHIQFVYMPPPIYKY